MLVDWLKGLFGKRTEKSAPNGIEKTVAAPAGERPVADPTFDIETLLPPPWIVAPHWPADSIGWRMGGEVFYFQFCDMFQSLSASGRADYERAYPAPDEWQPLYEALKERNPKS